MCVCVQFVRDVVDAFGDYLYDAGDELEKCIHQHTQQHIDQKTIAKVSIHTLTLMHIHAHACTFGPMSRCTHLLWLVPWQMDLSNLLHVLYTQCALLYVYLCLFCALSWLCPVLCVLCSCVCAYVMCV